MTRCTMRSVASTTTTRSATGNIRRSNRVSSRHEPPSPQFGWPPRPRSSNGWNCSSALRPPDGRGRGRPRRQPWLAVTNAENNYDYAGQDPINGYDLDGKCVQNSNTLVICGILVVVVASGLSDCVMAAICVGHRDINPSRHSVQPSANFAAVPPPTNE